MSKFLLGVIVTLLVLAVCGIGLALLGFFPTNANATPPHIEQQIATAALDASMERRAPRVSNPTPPTDDNLIDGLKIYAMNCALCHGGLDRQPSVLGKSFYPPAPSLILYPLDDPEWHIFYTVRTGVRYTGMPSWEKSISESDMWKVTAFLTRVEKLPPAVQDYWKKSAGAAPPAEEGHEHHDHSDHK
jgi:mono/diheme cytochrome c family protein